MLSKRSNKKALFLLNAIEQHISGGDIPSLNLTLEHVLPYSPNDTWQEYFGIETYNDAIDRLGNMAMFPKTKNMSQEGFLR